MSPSCFTYSARRLRHTPLVPAPGRLEVIMSRPLKLASAVSVTPLFLQPGSVLFAESDLLDITGAVRRHLEGPTGDSEFRLGLSILLSITGPFHDSGRLTDIQEARIDRWIDRHAKFSIATNVSQKSFGMDSPRGAFNGIRAVWERQHNFQTIH